MKNKLNRHFAPGQKRVPKSVFTFGTQDLLDFVKIARGSDAVFLFLFCRHIASVPITSRTHSDGGAVIGKPGSTRLEGTPAMDNGFNSKRIHT